MKFILLAKLAIIFWAAIPKWYDMLKDIHQRRQRNRRRRARRS